jgi:NDP-sugar pyrophosphorylase family protein
VRIGPGTVVEAGATVGPDAVLGARARATAGSVITRSVVWPDSVVRGAVDGAIVTPRQTICAVAPKSGGAAVG